MVSAIRRLLDEISWEGNARKYREGGLGLENVLTVEVFQALDFLPREAFLGAVLRAAIGAESAREKAAREVADLVVDVLPGDLSHPDIPIRAQPDAVMSSSEAYVFVEAKRIRRSSFPEEQLARELLLAAHHAEGRPPLLLLVLGVPPPLPVPGHGALAIADTIALGKERISRRLGEDIAMPDPATSVAYVTWADIAKQVTLAVSAFAHPDDAATQTVRRIASSAVDAVRVHG